MIIRREILNCKLSLVDIVIIQQLIIKLRTYILILLTSSNQYHTIPILEMRRRNSIVLNPESLFQADHNLKSAINTMNQQNGKQDQIITSARAILKIPPEARTNLENKFLNKFSKRSPFFTTIAENSSPQVAINILRYAHIYDITKNRTVINKGSEIENIIVLLSGKFGLVDYGQPAKAQLQKEEGPVFKRIIDNSLKIARDLRRRIKDIPQDPQQILQFKTTKAAMFDLSFRRHIQNQQQVFNINSLINGKKYSQTLVTCKNSIILTVSSKVFYQNLASYVKKVKAQKISAFRKFQYFNNVESDRLIQLVDQLPLVTLKKGQYVYKQGQQMKQIYLLLKGSIKITKTVDLFRQNPNLFYVNRQKLSGTKKLPFADFSQVYNYKPRTKLLQIGITNDLAIFGEEEFFSESNIRQVNAQIGTESAVFYSISLEKLDESLNDIKGFMTEFKQGLYKNQTMKKISYRQQKLSQLLICQTKNSMDYFFLQENSDQLEPSKPQFSPRKYKINKVNQLISPMKSQKHKQSSVKQAAYNTFNFNKFPLNLNLNLRKKQPNRSMSQLSDAQSKIIDLIHTMSARPQSSTEQTNNRQRKPKSPRKSSSPLSKKIQINIHNPLFDMSYFHKNRKQALRIQKQSRSRPLTSSNLYPKPATTARKMAHSNGL